MLEYAQWRSAVFMRGQSGANIESQFAAVLAVRGVLDEHFGTGRAACRRQAVRAGM
jgi:hypothetical protein